MRLRLDPWATEYGTAVDVDTAEAGEPNVDVDPFAETEEWSPIDPPDVPRPEVIAFIDGVQRVEVNVLADVDEGIVFGAFASVAVGAALSSPDNPRVQPRAPHRTLALTGGASDDLREVPCGTATLRFEVESTSVRGPGAVQEALATVRRNAETRLGQEMVQEGCPLVIVDGRLSFPPSRRSMAVGFVKTIHKHYLGPAQLPLLFQLRRATRTPLFRIRRESPVYSWYVRLNDHRPVEHPWAGLARLETLEGIGLEKAVRLADLTARHLPAFASSAAWDPRAPQNLYPISALEQQLHHELGDHTWIRRAIETYLQTEGAA